MSKKNVFVKFKHIKLFAGAFSHSAQIWKPAVRRFHLCPFCNYSTMKKSHLRDHIFTHTGERPFTCEVCGKSFTQKSSLKTHSIVHNKHITSYKTKYSKSESLTFNTSAIFHAPTTPYFVCRICEYCTTVKTNYNRHMLVHTGERPHVFIFFKKNFFFILGYKIVNSKISSISFLKPRRTTTHQCSTCGFSTTYKHAFKRHMYLHTGERPYVCNVCGKGYTEKADLKRHFLTHSGKRPFECSVCGKRFNQKSHLKSHLFIIHASKQLK
nr:zinc finger protein 555-like [Parasteatoda tepidariorum]